MIVQAVKWIGDIDGYIELVDQRRLPAEFVTLQCRDVEVLFDAIKTLAVRGAPAIGVAAAYGPLLALQTLGPDADLQQHVKTVSQACDHLAGSRPTAVNLFWALDRIRSKAAELASKRMPTRATSARGCWPRPTQSAKRTSTCAQRSADAARSCSKTASAS